MPKPYNEIRTGHDREVFAGALIGSIVAVLVLWDLAHRVINWFS